MEARAGLQQLVYDNPIGCLTGNFRGTKYQAVTSGLSNRFVDPPPLKSKAPATSAKVTGARYFVAVEVGAFCQNSAAAATLLDGEGGQ